MALNILESIGSAIDKVHVKPGKLHSKAKGLYLHKIDEEFRNVNLVE